MNKQALTEQAAKLQAELDELKRQLNEPISFECWQPKYGEAYHYINGAGNACVSVWNNHATDIRRFNNFNIYRTQEEAERTAKRCAALRELDSIAVHVNEGWVPDWGDSYQEKRSICFDYVDGAFRYRWNSFRSEGVPVYFKSLEAAERALELMSDTAKNLLKGVL